MISLFEAEGDWYRGNLHMHTTVSDGKLEPEQALALYRKAGYDFVALTDHWVQNREQQREDGLLVLPGCEFDTGDMVKFPVFHIVGVGMKRKVALGRSFSRKPQAIIDAVRDAGGIAILAHPAWSVTDPELCMELSGLSGAEIYNSVSGLPWNARPDSGMYFDIWASKGKLMRCMAADDSHFYEGEQTRSYIMVKAPTLSRDAIINAIEVGNFYASQGPRFNSVTCDGETVEVSCPEVEAIVFYSNTVWCADRAATGGVTHAIYTIKPTDTSVRVELIAKDGSRAWTSPFAVNR